MKNIRAFFLLVAFFLSNSTFCHERKYRIDKVHFSNAWHEFYDFIAHESEIDDPLIIQGKRMVPAICSAVAHEDMKYRRYAIGALGYIKDRRAIPCLERILKNKKELEYFRGDALESIYRIDQEIGKKYADKFRKDKEYLRIISDHIRSGKIEIDESGLDGH